VRSSRLAALPWTEAARSLQQRVAFLHHRLGPPWPDVSDRALLAGLDDWLVPLLAGATGQADLEAVDLPAVLRRRLGWQQAQSLDRLAPARLQLPSGRSVALDYSTDPPSAAVRVQQVFGLREHPTVGGVPVVLHLLSPADRPVQVTSDLPGFWAGSWRDVRKAMAGRYPKHAWPEDPAGP
jgi:ATP-dependent helicase HrpB